MPSPPTNRLNIYLFSCKPDEQFTDCKIIHNGKDSVSFFLVFMPYLHNFHFISHLMVQNECFSSNQPLQSPSITNKEEKSKKIASLFKKTC